MDAKAVDPSEAGPGWLGGRGHIDSIWCSFRVDPAEIADRLPAPLALEEDAEGTVLVYLGRNLRTQAGLLGIWSPLGVFDYTEVFVAIPRVVHPSTGTPAVHLHRIVLDHRLAELSGALYHFPVTRTAIERSSDGLAFRVPRPDIDLDAKFESPGEWTGLEGHEREAWWRSLSTDWITAKGTSLYRAPFHWGIEGTRIRRLEGRLTWASDALGFSARSPNEVLHIEARWRVAAPGAA